MSQKQASDPKSGSTTVPHVDLEPLGQEVDVVRFAVAPDYKGKIHLGLSVNPRSNVFGEKSKDCPEAVAIPDHLRVTWFPSVGLLRFQRTRIDTAPGVDPVAVLEEKWLNDSTEAFLWWETRSLVKRVTPQSK